MARVDLRSVRKSYGPTEVIHGIDLAIADGEFVVIVGPSGCGKSTLLRMVAGLETITAGDIAIGERVVNRLEPKDRDIAMVFQNYALYPHMSVYQNMSYGLRIRGMSKREIDQRVRKAAGILALEDFLDRRPRQLSGGQRQRVAMGRAIVREPAVFLFDEPLSNLDAKLRVQMRLEIQKLHRALRTTSLYVTHDQVEAMTLAHRMLVMNGGVAEQVGTPMDVYEEPATRFVAGFIGSPSMNFVNAAAEGAELALPGGRRFRPGGTPITRGEVVLGVRPEHLTACEAESAAFSGEVEMVEALGADTLIHFDFQGTPMIARLPHSHHPALGSVAHFRPGAGRVYLFDAATGARLERS